ncbi:F420H(2):quinone oxidoreductase [Stenotrophomonas sp. ZAC14D1_NAIMI4_6]|uniref:BLUF domain-containing protein n=1 Tax=Stenotrophomonas TaxID=40323 RepID=UPI0009A16A03|nr:MULTISPECIES: BLUF domain-containing protein [Stenotrophomonas]AWH37200.1 F420H(2):quinone oxidoreductase [Stenotrophomonas sp. ZAC14D1_NAIMI4_6]AWH41390.1 F420H(2):quinone oxidoreductase [Stenotrophomonas sp. ZAC14D1_NAIMI4_1]
MLRAVAYRSVAVPGIDALRLERIVEGAQRFNRMAGVTGAMLFDGARFLQYVEGPADGIEGAIGRIRASADHDRLHMLGDAVIDARRFPAWDMSCLMQPNTVLDRLFVARWGTVDHSLDDSGTHVGGVVLLRRLLERPDA